MKKIKMDENLLEENEIRNMIKLKKSATVTFEIKVENDIEEAIRIFNKLVKNDISPEITITE